MNTNNAEQAPSVTVDNSRKTRKELVVEAQKEIRTNINTLRLQILGQLDELAEIGGKDVYEEALLVFVDAAGPEGIQISKLHAVLPDSAALTEARIKLVDKKRINSVKSGVSFKLTPVEA